MGDVVVVDHPVVRLSVCLSVCASLARAQLSMARWRLTFSEVVG